MEQLALSKEGLLGETICYFFFIAVLFLSRFVICNSKLIYLLFQI